MDFFSFLLGTHRYQGFAVVRKANIQSFDDIEGKKSCHTGYRKTVGWHIPVSTVS